MTDLQVFWWCCIFPGVAACAIFWLDNYIEEHADIIVKFIEKRLGRH